MVAVIFFCYFGSEVRGVGWDFLRKENIHRWKNVFGPKIVVTSKKVRLSVLSLHGFHWAVLPRHWPHFHICCEKNGYDYFALINNIKRLWTITTTKPRLPLFAIIFVTKLLLWWLLNENWKKKTANKTQMRIGWIDEMKFYISIKESKYEQSFLIMNYYKVFCFSVKKCGWFI